jgi:hypothetical protein
MMPAVQTALPGVVPIERRNMNVWEDDHVRSAIGYHRNGTRPHQDESDPPVEFSSIFGLLFNMPGIFFVNKLLYRRKIRTPKLSCDLPKHVLPRSLIAAHNAVSWRRLPLMAGV